MEILPNREAGKDMGNGRRRASDFGELVQNNAA